MRHHLGSWLTPDGNRVEAVLVGRGVVRDLVLTWDTFPLSSVDAAYYKSVILPAVIDRARGYLEITGAAMVLTP